MPNLKQFIRKIDRTFWFEKFLFWIIDKMMALPFALSILTVLLLTKIDFVRAMGNRQHEQEHQQNFDGQHFIVEINQYAAILQIDNKWEAILISSTIAFLPLAHAQNQDNWDLEIFLTTVIMSKEFHMTRFLPDTPNNTPAATCVLRQTFYSFYFFRQRHVSSKIAGRAMRGNIF